jgi:hypothetical protein
MKRILAAALLLLVIGSPAAFAKHYKYPHPVTKHPVGHHPHRKK